jgi:tetratricopeptide (TPR) repeat protein
MRHWVRRAIYLVAALPIAASAQTYDPASGKSPLTLLAAPHDGLEHLATKERARALHAERKWAEAEPLWERLAAELPRDPENWIRRAEAEEQQGKFAEAVESRRAAGALIGWDGSFPHGYHLAADQLRAGDRRAALDTLKWMIFDQHGIRRADLYDFAPLEGLRNDPEFLALIGRPDTSKWTRETGWAKDLDFLREEVVRLNPEYRDRPLPEGFGRIQGELKRDIASLSDEQLYFGMMRMLATLRQGHVTLYAFHDEHFLPLRLYAFPEGLFVIGAAAEHQALVGARIVRVGQLPAAEALRRVAEAQSVDAPMEYLWIAPMALTQTSALKGMGAIDRTDRVALVLEMPDGKQRTLDLPTTATQPVRTPADRPDKLIAPAGVPAPLFLAESRQAHWEKPLPDQDALYVQVNNMMGDEGESLRAFGNRIAALLAEKRPRNLIVDLRHNNGGDTTQYPSLLRTVIAFSRIEGNRVYALIGRRTYSAAGNFVTDLDRLADPIFVGEASSECCFLHGDPGAIVLPYSGLRGELTAVTWQLTNPFDRRREMSPDVPVQLTAKDYFAGRDPVLDAVFAHIAKGRKP